MATDKKVIAFDLYGTLLSTESIAKQLESHFPGKAQSISSLWRRYQLEYTWRLNSMGIIESFGKLTALANTVQESTSASQTSPAAPCSTPSPNTTSRFPTTPSPP
jgi:HAD superfamily hydrolase (TIGR01493 family)